MEDSTKELCKKHTEKVLEFACLNSKCRAQAISCFLCVKNEHSRCPDESIISRAVLKTMQIDTKELEGVREALCRVFEQHRKRIEEELAECEKIYSLAFDLKALGKESTNAELASVRKMLNISTEGSEVKAVSKFAGADSARVASNDFSKSVTSAMTSFANGMRKIRLVGSSVVVDSFDKHANVSIRDGDEGLEFSTGQINENYYCAISKEPLRAGHMTIKIKQVPDFGRYIEFGVIQSGDNLQSIANNSYVSTLNQQNAWTYSGAYSNHMEGAGVTGDESSAAGLGAGKTYEVEFDADAKTIKITGDAGAANLNGVLADREYRYYFVFYYSNSSCVVTFD